MEPSLTDVPLPTRWKADWVRRRRRIEADRLARAGHRAPAEGLGLAAPYRILRLGLKAARLYERGYRNFVDVQTTRLTHPLNGWPGALDGFRILQLSDLHIDLDPALLPVVCNRLAPLDYEMAVITGDYWEGAHPAPQPAINAISRVLESIGIPPFGVHGVLGNHDALPLAAALEGIGLNLLINEAVTLGSGSARFALAGIDDPYFFRTEDVLEAARHCPPGIPRILLSHSPQVAPVAREAGFSLMLSGHTHGGQICLPGGHSILTMEEIPRALFRGPWRQGPLTGYTTTGTGACHLPVRFNCPPEVVLHTIRATG